MDKAPWRKVVKAYRPPLNRNMKPLRIINELECGHSLTFSGENAGDAEVVKRRRCHACQLAAEDRKP